MYGSPARTSGAIHSGVPMPRVRVMASRGRAPSPALDTTTHESGEQARAVMHDVPKSAIWVFQRSNGKRREGKGKGKGNTRHLDTKRICHKKIAWGS